MTHSIPVLIVGAGPTGLTMAACLTRYNIPFRIIDKQLKPVRTSNAIAVQARTLELWDDLGLIDYALAHGRQIHGMSVFAGNKPLVSLNLNELPSRYPFILALPQSETEKMLLEHLSEKNISVEMEVELIDFTEDGNMISAILRNKDGTQETLATQWLIACDGSHSLIREKAKLPFKGKELEEHFILADMPAEIQNTSAGNACLFLSDHGPLIFIQYNQQNARVIAEVTDDPELHAAKSVTLDQIHQIFTQRCPFPVVLQQPIWTSGFWIQERLISRFRQQRIFFMGDAAHVHSPAGGQGMNTGIQDAYNLAWKLAFVIQKNAPLTILDSYHIERYAIAKSLLRNTTLMTYMMTTRLSFLKIVRNFMMPLFLGFAMTRQRITATISQLNIFYKNSPLTRNYLNHPTALAAGRRMLDVQLGETRLFDSVRGADFCLLIFDGKQSQLAMNELVNLQKALQEKYPGLIKILLVSANEEKLAQWNNAKIFDQHYLVHDQYGMANAGLYLIRPDKYIGFRGTMAHLKELFEYLGSSMLNHL